ncbi:cytochrome P450 3A13-like [Ornithodoros turicata]|uniref:cytochrome P450 3A13-like n=1 Tax=Ornithodoros turicata TaxID=34597 RepID=UPI003139DC12
MECVWWVCALVGFCTLIYVWRKRRFSLFKDLGIPGPEPNLFSGNMREFVTKGAAACYTQWIKEYGDVVGFYNGSIPFLIIKDLDVVKRIQIKDFGNFQARGVLSLFGVYNRSARYSVFNTDADRWKELRSMLTPTFTSGKMKQMLGLLKSCTNEFLEALGNKEGNPFNIYDDFQRLTMDVIVRAAFGVEMDFQKGDETTTQARLLETAKETVKPSIIPGIRLVMNCFSELGILWRIFLFFFGWAFKQPVEDLTEDMETIIQFRRANPQAKREDLLQLMLDASVDSDEVVDVNKLEASYENDSASTGSTDHRSTARKKRTLSNREIRANATAFLIAGFETTSTALVFTTYLLARHQDVQEKLRSEVLQAMSKEGEFTYEAIFGMKYMEQVFCESLRFYPPVVGFTTRTASTEYCRNGVRIPGGVGVVVPTYDLHHDPNFWSEPDSFDPERFAPEKKAAIEPMAYQPFGGGPRNCVGMRFAQLEAKLALAKMLANYRIYLDESHHKGPLQYGSTTILALPKGGVWVRVEKLS